MRLLIATPLYPPDSGGPATYSRLLEDEFAHPVTVVKFSDVRGYPKFIRHIVYFWNVFVEAKNADVVLALDPVSVGLPALWAARLRRKPFVVKVVGDYAWEQGVQRFGITDTLDTFVCRAHIPFPVAFLRAIQMHVVHGAQKVIVPSKYLKGIVEKWGTTPSKITVIYNAIELEEIGAIPHALTGLPKPWVVTIGRLVPWKHVDGIIDAVSELNASLIVVGDGPEYVALQKRAQVELPGRVHFTGAIPHAEALTILSHADCFTLNSSYEGLSHVLIEALMLGVPVIATHAGGNAELIRNAENGVLVPPRDTQALTNALHHVLSDGEYRATLSTNARRAREDFSASRMRTHTAEFLSTL
jgi:glycosyltransferase involved in cell wall biosynthesis